MPPKLSQNLAQCFINWRISEIFLVQSSMWTISYNYDFVYSPKLYTLENFILLYFVLFFFFCLFVLVQEKNNTVIFIES